MENVRIVAKWSAMAWAYAAEHRAARRARPRAIAGIAALEKRVAMLFSNFRAIRSQAKAIRFSEFPCCEFRLKRAEVEAHLAACSACRRDLEVERESASEIANLPLNADAGWAAMRGRWGSRPWIGISPRGIDEKDGWGASFGPSQIMLPIEPNPAW